MEGVNGSGCSVAQAYVSDAPDKTALSRQVDTVRADAAQSHGNLFTAFRAPYCPLTLSLAQPVQGARKCPFPVTDQTHSTQLRCLAWPSPAPQGDCST